MLSPPITQNQKKTSSESLAHGYNTGLHHHHEIQLMEFQMSVDNANSPIIATICRLKINKYRQKEGCVSCNTKNTFQKWFSS